MNLCWEFIRLPTPYNQSLNWDVSFIASTLSFADQIRFLGPDIPNVSVCCYGNDKCISDFQTWKRQSSPNDHVTPQAVVLCDVFVPCILLSLLDFFLSLWIWRRRCVCHFKPPPNVVWIWFAGIEFHVFCFVFLKWICICWRPDVGW